MRHLLARSLEPIRAASRTTIFFLKVLPMLPSRAVDWITPDPVVTRVRYPTPSGETTGDLYRPAGPGPHPAIVICLGVVPFGEEHPQVPRLGDALARAGFATLMYWSPTMRDLRLDPGDIDGIALAYRWLTDQPGIDAARSGLLGTCVGGSFALMAAAQPEVRDRLAFVIAWAPYVSMRSLARDIASATTRRNGEPEPWAVDQLTRRVFVRSLTDPLAPDEATLLRDACAERTTATPIADELSETGHAIYPLLTALDPTAAGAALDHLPELLLQRLDTLSPLTYLPEIHTPVIHLAHDRDDSVIPIAQSRELLTALAGRDGVQYTEFTMFKHLDPSKVHLPLIALARELGKFLGAVYPLFRLAVRHSSNPAAHNAPVRPRPDSELETQRS